MQQTRLLLPFHHGLHMDALEQAVRLAKGCDATLVLLALIQLRDGHRVKAPRLDLVQQARDFFAASKHKAAIYDVPVESMEVYTHDVQQAIETVADVMRCDGVVLFLAGENGVLLSERAISGLVASAARKLYIMRLPTHASKRIFGFLKIRSINGEKCSKIAQGAQNPA